MSHNDIETLVNQARCLVEQDQLSEARELFQRICELAPGNAEAWTMLGSIDKELGSFESAIAFFQRAIQVDSNYTDAYLNLAVIDLTLGHVQDALINCTKVVACDPDYGEAWILLGSIYGQLGNYEKAESASCKGIALMPSSVEAFATLAHALKNQGKTPQAISAYLSALSLQPDIPEIRLLLGNAYAQLKQFAEAENCYYAVVNQQPRNAGAYIALGNALLAQRKFADALPIYRQALQLEPLDAETQNNLGNALLALGNLHDAEQSFREALRIKTDYPEAFANLGLIFQSQGKLAEAVTSYQRAVDIKPEMPELHYKLAAGLEAQGKFKDALASCETALRLMPGFVDATVAKASILERQGQTEQSQELLASLIASGVAPIQAHLIYSELDSRPGRKDNALAMVMGLLERDGLSQRDRQQIHSALGKLYDQTEQYDNAFKHYRSANLLRESRFDPDQHTRYIDSLITTYNPGFMDRAPRSSVESDLPVFIVGMPRSGTTLVEQILSSHPEIFGAGELDNIQKASVALGMAGFQKPYPKCMEMVTSGALRDVSWDCVVQLRAMAPEVKRVSDKMPHNFLHLGLIELLFPKARVIHVTRDPLDTCLSVYFQEFSSTHSYACNLKHLGIYYKQYVKLMQHWKSVLKIPYMEICYEDLVADQETVSRAMIEFCGLEWDKRCLKFYENRRYVATPSYDQVRRPMYSKSVGRWRHYERHLQELKAEI